MKRVSSVVWQFFDRLEENKRCVAVLCKLCDSEYKYFGNTTNLRAHLIKKHPLQWEFRQNSLDGKVLGEQPMIRAYEEDGTTDLTEVSPKSSPKRRKYVHSTSNQNVECLGNIENDHGGDDEDTDTLNLVRQMHDDQGSDEEWLEEDYVQVDMYEPTRKAASRKIKREVVAPIQQETLTYLPRSSVKPQKTECSHVDDSNKDEYSIFGEYIANKLRKFKAPRTRGNIQQIITTILWQAEYGLYDDAEAVKRVILSSVQYNNINEQNPAQESDTQAPSEDYGEKLIDESNQSADTE